MEPLRLVGCRRMPIDSCTMPAWAYTRRSAADRLCLCALLPAAQECSAEACMQLPAASMEPLRLVGCRRMPIDSRTMPAWAWQQHSAHVHGKQPQPRPAAASSDSSASILTCSCPACELLSRACSTVALPLPRQPVVQRAADLSLQACQHVAQRPIRVGSSVNVRVFRLPQQLVLHAQHLHLGRLQQCNFSV